MSLPETSNRLLHYATQDPEYRGLNNTWRGDMKKKICKESSGLRGGPPVGQLWGVTRKGRIMFF